ncbi:MAG: tetratricopeptide repeat-containing sensor histidine kinase [Bacteroidales bacterium]
MGIRRKLTDEAGIATSLNNLALVYQELGKYAKALEFLFEAAELRFKLKDDYGLGIVYNNIAEIYALLGDYRKTIQYNELSLLARKRAGDETGKTYNYNNLVNAYLKLGNLPRAKAYLDSSLQLAKQLKALPRLVKTWEFKISWHKAAGQKDSVIKAYEELVALKDSLARKTLEEEIAHTEARYGVMQKAAEVNRLNQLVKLQQLETENAHNKARNTRLFGIIILGIILSVFGAVMAHLRHRSRVMLERQKLELQQKTFLEVMSAEDRERQRLAMELHDGLGQTLSAALLNVRALPEQPSGQGYEPRKSAEKAIQTAIEDMRRISHNLMPGALIRKGLTHALEEMAQTVNSSHKAKINLHLNDSVDLPLQTQHTLYRVIQETVNNILKHSQATEINISMKTENNRFSLEIRDNGNCVELPQDNPVKGIGLESLKQRINFLKGIWRLERTCEEQNIFKIEFSLSES